MFWWLNLGTHPEAVAFKQGHLQWLFELDLCPVWMNVHTKVCILTWVVVFPMVPVLGLPLPCLPLEAYSPFLGIAGFLPLFAPPAALYRPGKLEQGPHHHFHTVLSWDFLPQTN